MKTKILKLLMWTTLFMVAGISAAIAAVSVANAQCPGGQCPSQQQQWQQPRQQPRLFNRGEDRAERVDQPCPYPALVIVDFLLPGNEEETARSSGFIADRDEKEGSAIVVTCAHGYKAMMQVHVITQDKKTYEAAILGIDAVNDLCVVAIKDPGIKPLKIAKIAPKIGDKLFMAGFAHGKKFMGRWGKMKKWWSPSKNGPAVFIETTCQTIQGCSGGPILNEEGRVVATVTGNPGGCVGPCLQKTLYQMKLDPEYSISENFIPAYQAEPSSLLPWRKGVEEVNKQQSAEIAQIKALPVPGQCGPGGCPAAAPDDGTKARIAALEAALAEKKAAEAKEDGEGPKTALGRLRQKEADWLAEHGGPLSSRIAASASEKLDSDSPGVRFVGFTQVGMAIILFCVGILLAFGIAVGLLHKINNKVIPILEAQAAKTSNTLDDKVVSLLRSAHDRVDALEARVKARISPVSATSSADVTAPASTATTAASDPVVG